ncbi:hypothetical protein A3219_05555 [Salmonella enterica]|nr:hypothetical protein A3219_05555 [Salmonella enterica]
MRLSCKISRRLASALKCDVLTLQQKLLRCLSSPDFPEEPPEGGFFLRSLVNQADAWRLR